jgi:hypothetical protein
MGNPPKLNTKVLKMTKSTKTPLELFFSDSVRWAKCRAKKDGIFFDSRITPTFLEGMFKGQNGICGLTGQRMELVRGGDWYGKGKFGKNPMVASIDRKFPVLGYTLDNIHLACTKWNTLKGDMDIVAWFTMCQNGASHSTLQLLDKQGWQG